MTAPTGVAWAVFAAREPELAAFGTTRMASAPCYLATIRADGTPRVHPVTPIVANQALFLFTEPTSPKASDLAERGWFALHNDIADDAGTGGESWVRGHAALSDDPIGRQHATNAAAYTPEPGYPPHELLITEVRGTGYGDTLLPATKRWTPTTETRNP
ncbi:MAG: hypothetical protein WBM50_04260 [Acidimicrobiales bacterium]